MLREWHASPLIVPSMSHLVLSVSKLAQFVGAHLGDRSFDLVAEPDRHPCLSFRDAEVGNRRHAAYA